MQNQPSQHIINLFPDPNLILEQQQDPNQVVRVQLTETHYLEGSIWGQTVSIKYCITTRRVRIEYSHFPARRELLNFAEAYLEDLILRIGRHCIGRVQNTIANHQTLIEDFDQSRYYLFRWSHSQNSWVQASSGRIVTSEEEEYSDIDQVLYYPYN